MTDTTPALEEILLAALFAADRPLPLDELAGVFELGDEIPRPETSELEEALERARERISGLPLDIRKLAGGYRIEVPQAYASWVSRLWVERPARYSRALLETLALIAYRQPITRPEIEQVRGVTVNTQIIRTLSERGWIRVVGHRDAPGRPALYGTTRTFLDYFGLASLEELPTLAEIRELADFEPELPLGEEAAAGDSGDGAAKPGGDVEAAGNVSDAGDLEDADTVGGEVVHGPWAPEDSGSDEEDASEKGDEPAPRK